MLLVHKLYCKETWFSDMHLYSDLACLLLLYSGLILTKIIFVSWFRVKGNGVNTLMIEYYDELLCFTVDWKCN
jgi:hypothetical protein